MISSLTPTFTATRFGPLASGVREEFHTKTQRLKTHVCGKSMNPEIEQIGKDGVDAPITEGAPQSWTLLSALVPLCETL